MVVSLISLPACDREPPPPAPAEAREATPPTERSSERTRSVWPWGRTAAVEEEVARAEAEAEAERARAEQQRAEAEAKRDLERRLIAQMEDEAAIERGAAPGTPAPESALMSRDEPELHVLAAPPFAYTLRAPASVTHQGPQPTLVQLSSKRNRIIDEEAWFTTNKLSLPLYTLPAWPSAGPRFGVAPPGGPRVPRGGSGEVLPPEIPTTFAGHPIAKAIKGSEGTIAIHDPDSTRVVAYDALGDAFGAFDFSAYGRAMDVRWAEAHEGVLYACTSNLYYASDSGGLNAFMTAIELRTGELLWQSEPLVCNVHSFVVRDGWIVSGYGYTAEPDFLFVLDMKTGATVQRVALESGPEEIVDKGGKLYVRTYDRDYVFALR